MKYVLVLLLPLFFAACFPAEHESVSPKVENQSVGTMSDLEVASRHTRFLERAKGINAEKAQENVVSFCGQTEDLYFNESFLMEPKGLQILFFAELLENKSFKDFQDTLSLGEVRQFSACVKSVDWESEYFAFKEIIWEMPDFLKDLVPLKEHQTGKYFYQTFDDVQVYLELSIKSPEGPESRTLVKLTTKDLVVKHEHGWKPEDNQKTWPELKKGVEQELSLNPDKSTYRDSRRLSPFYKWMPQAKTHILKTHLPYTQFINTLRNNPDNFEVTVIE